MMAAMSNDPTDDGTGEPPAPANAAAVAALVEQHREFLAFVQRRLPDRAAAEDLLQEAFVRGLERSGQLRDGESARAWFFRILRNALLDHARRAAAADRRLARVAEQERAAAVDERELDRIACACVGRLAATLQPDWATALRRVEVDGLAVTDYAREAGITANNAGVRLFRARNALRRQVARSCGSCADHGCLDCSCKPQA